MISKIAILILSLGVYSLSSAQGVCLAQCDSVMNDVGCNNCSLEDKPNPSKVENFLAQSRKNSGAEQPEAKPSSDELALPQTSVSSTQKKTKAEREAVIRELVEAMHAREMPGRLIDTTFEKLLVRKDAVADDVATAMDEALLPGDISAADRAKLHNEMYKGGKEKLQQTRGYLDRLEIPKFAVVVLHHLLQENYTDAELDQLLAFWQSPVGKKTIDLLPSMTENFVELAHQYFPPKIEEVQNEIIRDAEGRGARRRR